MQKPIVPVYHQLPTDDLLILQRAIICSLAHGNLNRTEKEMMLEVLEHIKKAIGTYYHP